MSQPVHLQLIFVPFTFHVRFQCRLSYVWNVDHSIAAFAQGLFPVRFKCSQPAFVLGINFPMPIIIAVFSLTLCCKNYYYMHMKFKGHNCTKRYEEERFVTTAFYWMGLQIMVEHFKTFMYSVQYIEQELLYLLSLVFICWENPRRSGILLFRDHPRLCRLMKTQNRRYSQLSVPSGMSASVGDGYQSPKLLGSSPPITNNRENLGQTSCKYPIYRQNLGWWAKGKIPDCLGLDFPNTWKPGFRTVLTLYRNLKYVSTLFTLCWLWIMCYTC